MWIKFKKTYSGHLGFFEGGIKKDLPESIVNQLPKKFYQKTCAPWEEQTDPAALAVIAAHAKAAEAVQLAEKLRKIADEADRYRDELVPVATEKQDASDKAGQAAEQAVAAAKKADIKSKSENEKKKYRALLARANELVAVHNRADLESQKASGLLTAAIADAGLKHLDANAAKAEADQLAAEADQLAKAKAAAEPKEETKENGSEDADQKDQVKKTDDPQSDNPESEGQTVPPGQG